MSTIIRHQLLKVDHEPHHLILQEALAGGKLHVLSLEVLPNFLVCLKRLFLSINPKEKVERC